MLNYSIQLITGHYDDVVIWMVVLDNESLPAFGSECRQIGLAVQCEIVWGFFFLLICVLYHFEVCLLQLPSSFFQPFSENSQLCVLSPQPPDLLLGLWGAALSLNTRETKTHHQTMPAANSNTAVHNKTVAGNVIEGSLFNRELETLPGRALCMWYDIQHFKDYLNRGCFLFHNPKNRMNFKMWYFGSRFFLVQSFYLI